jgi:hypothetical protein
MINHNPRPGPAPGIQALILLLLLIALILIASGLGYIPISAEQVVRVVGLVYSAWMI